MTRDEAWLLEEKYQGLTSLEFEADKRRLAAGEPVAYVIGWQPFLGLKIYLDSKPLIPRAETEWWVEQLIREIKNKLSGHEFSVLDLCAGSGAIGCTILKNFPNAHVYFGEIDPEHEVTIRKNIAANNLDATRATIGIGDLLAPFGDSKFDYIAVNPPYIPVARELPASVANYEPALALRAGSLGLTVIGRIANELGAHLAPEGQAWVECDVENVEAACGLFEAAGFKAFIRQDQFGLPRVLVIS